MKVSLLGDPGPRARLTVLAGRVAHARHTPLEDAVWWSEYVMSHRGAKHLQSGTQ